MSANSGSSLRVRGGLAVIGEVGTGLRIIPARAGRTYLDWYDPERYAKLYDYIKDGAIRFQKGAEPLEKELDVAIFLADAGHQVRFLKPGFGRSADTEVDGVIREFKVPEGDKGNSFNDDNAKHQFRHTTYNSKGEFAPQADDLLISHHLIADQVSFVDYLIQVTEAWSMEEFQYLQSVWLTDASGGVHYLKKN